jgi:hypothetical protein
MLQSRTSTEAGRAPGVGVGRCSALRAETISASDQSRLSYSAELATREPAHLGSRQDTGWTMPNVGQVERAIERVEGFRVRVRHPQGRDVRSDRAKLPGYPYKRGLNGNKTVRQWADLRFTRNYSGWSVEVLQPNNKPAHGRNLLSTVRGMYAD